jgi:hypothetical protein
MANINSDHPIPSSSQQPYPTPQPASVQAASPPTKQNLKSWWAGFRKETKKQDAQGNYRAHYNPNIPSRDAFARQDSVFAAKTPRQHSATFREAGLAENAVVACGFSTHNIALKISAIDASATRLSDRKLASDAPCNSNKVRRTSSCVWTTNNAKKWQLRKAASVQALKSEKSLETQLQHERSETSDAFHAGTESFSKPQNISQLFDVFNVFRLKRFAKLIGQTAEQAPGIFGVPLRQSITYANVAISLVDGEGKSYIYGYVPIVVAKCGVYLKEKGVHQPDNFDKTTN